MNKLSAVIITLNEERNIARCLHSLLPVADEIIVVDSLSTDATAQICQQFPVRFVQREWQGYVDTKNYANSLATNDLILTIDADEAVSEELARSINRIKEQDITNKAFKMSMMMNYCGKWIRHGCWYPDIHTRIFDRRRVQWTGQKVHERLDIPQDYTIERLQGDLLHYSFYTVDEHRKQARKFARLSAEEAIENGKTVSLAGCYTHAIWKFIRDYLFKLGFLDGRYGWIISRVNAFDNVFEKYWIIRNHSRK